MQSKRRRDNLTHEFLDSIKWERMLLQFMTDITQEFGYRHILVEPAEQNPWYYRYMEGSDFYNDTLEEHQNRMRMRYDTTAKRNGFKFDPILNAFAKKL